MNQMRSSSSNKNERTMASVAPVTQQMYDLLLRLRSLSSFHLILYMDEAEQLQFFFEVKNNFPKDQVLPGLVRAAEKLSADLLSHFKDSPDTDKYIEQLVAMMEESQNTEQPKQVHRATIIQLPTQGADETEKID